MDGLPDVGFFFFTVKDQIQILRVGKNNVLAKYSLWLMNILCSCYVACNYYCVCEWLSFPVYPMPDFRLDNVVILKLL